ncbi:MAG: radical SAM protein [Acidobacteria bacterium]|nr:radical SAM protein [Acidobacteriota bacterium]MCA1639916.1 radical SAM protein [Acidobacteriota bacterium]
MTITPARTGYDAALNNVAGQIFEQLVLNPDLFPQLNHQYSHFFQQCQKYGWLSENGRLNGSFTKVEREPHLKRLQIELTRHCNLRCGYCYSMSGPSVRTKLLIEQVEAILDDALDLGCIWIDYTGGEPLLYRDWQRALKAARERGMVVSLHSNGTLLNEKNLTFLAEIGISHLQVSADSHLPAIHDSIRGSKGSHAKTVASIKLAQRLGLKVRVTLMAHKGNKENFAETVKWFNDELGASVLLDRVIAAGGELEAQTGLTPQEYFELIAPLIKRNIASTRICDNKSEATPSLIEPHCGVAHSFVYITAEGEFALCPTMTSRDRSFFAGPNIAESSLKTAWRESPYFNRYRYTNCSNIGHCPTAKTCGGGCRSNAYFETGDINSPDQISCNMQKNPTPVFVNFLGRYRQGKYDYVTAKS